MVARIDIERALEKLADDEAGFRFQSLAVVLAKLRWRDLIASERHKDRGLDAYVSAADSTDGRGKGLACSTTGTRRKISDDAAQAQKHYPDVSLLIFYTTEKVTQETKAKWAEEIRQQFGYELVVASREEIIATLQIPDNAQLCRSHLDIPVPFQPAITDLLSRSREAAAVVAAEWAAHPRLSGKPHIVLDTIALSKGSDVAGMVSTSSLRSLLEQGRRLVLEGSAGRGKTTTLIQIAGANQPARGIPILVDLPNWVRSGNDILDYVASSPSFRARGIDAQALARLSQAEPLLFLLNGWNEITEFYSSAAVDALRGLERAFPSAGIIVATRTHHIVPPLPGASRFRILPLTPRQRFDYLTHALGENSAQMLHVRLSRDRVLDDLTRTPFVLAEVTALFRAGRTIPRTKLGLLRAVIQLMEESDEHAVSLQSAPLRGLAEPYLRALALDLTSRGDTVIVAPDARAVCNRVSEALRNAGQIAAVPESAEILNTLTGHHLLERNEYPATSFRFEHQQFQEYYAALMVKDELKQIVASGDRPKSELFACRYVNNPVWSEPLQMIASDLGDAGSEVSAHKALVESALRLDAVFAARLAFDGGPSLWKDIRVEMHDRLRTLYAAPSQQLRGYALTAILATGSDEFTDIVLPLLVDANQQVRLRAYRSGNPFHPTSLGADWRAVVAGWSEELRAEFVSELTMHQGRVDIGLTFAQSDPSHRVRLVALHCLSWMGQSDAVADILQSLSDPEFELAIAQFHHKEIPTSLWPRAMATYRSRLNYTTDPKTRLQIALTLAELGDPETPARLKAELAALPHDVVRDVSDYALRPAVEILRRSDAQWLSDWVTDRVIEGGLWRDQWLSLILDIPPTRKAELLHRACTEDMKHSGALAILRAFSDPDTAKALFVAYRDYQPVLLGDPQNQEKQNLNYQLRDLLRSIPRSVVIDGLSDILSQPPTSEELPIITDLCGLRGADDAAANQSLSNAQRDRLRGYLKSAVPFVLTQDDFNGQGKGYLSCALSRFGRSSDMTDVMELVRADITRVREGRAARARDHRSPQARGAPMAWTSWHVEALIRLGGRDSESFLLSLLSEPEYEIEAAWGLYLIAHKTLTDPNVMGARSGHPQRDFCRIRSSASEWRAVFAEDRRQRSTAAITQRVLPLLRETNTADAQTVLYRHHRLRELAKPLAALDPRDSASLILQIAEIPGRFDGWTRVALLETLIFAGVPLPETRTRTILEPVLTEFRAHGIDSNTGHLLTLLLCLLPFVDEPKLGIARLRELLAEFRVSWSSNRNLLFAVAQCSDDAGVDLLCEIAGTNPGLFEHGAKDWFDAVANSPITGARQIILGFVDPNARACIAERNLPEYALDALAAHLARLARADRVVAARLTELTTHTLPPQPRAILAKILAWADTEAGLVAALDLIDDGAKPPIPYDVFRAIESLFLEKRPYGAKTQSFTLVPRAANDLKARLYELAKHDRRRAQSAYGLLAQIEEWRLEYGRPPSEPRHPCPESGEMWPPISAATFENPLRD
jgi:HEAT repeat protein